MKQGLLGLNYFFRSQSFSRTLAKYMKISDAHFWFHQNPQFFSEITNPSGSGKMNSNLDHTGSTGTLTICSNPLHLSTIRSKQAMWMLLMRHRFFIWWYLFWVIGGFSFSSFPPLHLGEYPLLPRVLTSDWLTLGKEARARQELDHWRPDQENFLFSVWG